MASKILDSIFLLTTFLLAFFIISSFNKLDNLNHKILESLRDKQEVTLMIDVFKERIENEGYSKAEIIKIFESVKATDIANFEYQESLDNTLESFKSLLIYVLIFQAGIAICLWHSSVFPKKTGNKGIVSENGMR